jgi:hypothetical protein
MKEIPLQNKLFKKFLNKKLFNKKYKNKRDQQKEHNRINKRELFLKGVEIVLWTILREGMRYQSF